MVRTETYTMAIYALETYSCREVAPVLVWGLWLKLYMLPGLCDTESCKRNAQYGTKNCKRYLWDEKIAALYGTRFAE